MIRDPSDGSTKTVVDHQSDASEPLKAMVSGVARKLGEGTKDVND